MKTSRVSIAVPPPMTAAPVAALPVTVVGIAPPAFAGIVAPAHSAQVAGSGVFRAMAAGISSGGAGPTAPGAGQGAYSNPVPYRLDFLQLGIVVTGDVGAVTPAGANNRTYLLQHYKATEKLRQPIPDAPYWKVFHRLLEAIGVVPDRMQLYVIDDPAPNAFWIRGSETICVTTGLLKKPGLTEGEFAHVVGHELGHCLKYHPHFVVPARFKNPLFRLFVQQTHAAGVQAEEYQVDELGLFIADAAGYSVDEALTIQQWLAQEEGAKPTAGATASRVLQLGASHPHGASRVGVTAATIEDTRFAWRNRGVAPCILPFAGDNFTACNSTDVQEFNDLHPDEAHPDPLDADAVVAHIAHCPSYGYFVESDEEPEDPYDNYDYRPLDETNMVGLLLADLSTQTIDASPRCAAAIRRLHQAAEQGDLVSQNYLHALVSKLYFDAVTRGAAAAKRRLTWLERNGGISTDEVLLALIASVESTGTINKQFAKEHRERDLITYAVTPMSSKHTLDEVVSSFPHSPLRDQLIGSLLRFPFHIKDQAEFFEIATDDDYADQDADQYQWSSYTNVHPLPLQRLSLDKTQTLLSYLHGPSIIDIEELSKEASYKIQGDISKIDHSLHEHLSDMVRYIYWTAGPFDRGALESALEESGDSARWLRQGKNIQYGSPLPSFYASMETRSQEFSTPFSRERLMGVARLVVLRGLEDIPANEWAPATIALVESMPPSTERNHLFILLHKAGKRAVQPHELVFKEIPSPDASSVVGDTASLVHAFGFVETGTAEGIYPSGQRVLDRFLADTLPSGALTLTAVTQTIPRASPIRDELLDRCPADDVETARNLLDAYWSPAAAYTQAFELATQWMERADGNRTVLEAILAITAEFPSLRRRMVTAWANRFGIQREDYVAMLKAAQDVDAIDLFRGSAVEHSRKAPRKAKAGLSLASFASMLVRDQYALLSLHDLESSHTPGIREEHSSKDEKRQFAEYLAFRDYHPLFPENAATVIALLDRGTRYQLIRVPFVDGRPTPNLRFQRNQFISEGLTELGRWNGAEAFSRFMRAMGWDEAVTFYEGLLLGEHGVMHDRRLRPAIEAIFLEGIALLLEEKGVPLARVEHVKKGLTLLLATQSLAIQGQIWARILAGIVQRLPMGEIVREAVRPLGSAGDKLMQAVHSLTTGVDATLEEATRLALDQTARMTLFDELQFLGARGVRPFDRHRYYRPLGQGSQRAAVAGVDEPTHAAEANEAYLLVHARRADPAIVRGIMDFIDALTQAGEYFPLTVAQFADLVEQTEGERAQGFVNHAEFGVLHDWLLGGTVHIPRIWETHADWARMELVHGVPYAALPPEQQQAVAPVVLGAALAQFGRPTATGTLKINPEMHGGNILYDSDRAETALVDCGLLGTATPDDVMGLLQIHAGFAAHGLAGAAATLLRRNGISNLTMLDDAGRAILLSGLEVFDHQLRIGTAPELLLPGLATVVARSTEHPVSTGFGVVSRAMQHLAPYLRATGNIFSLPRIFTTTPAEGLAEFAAAIDHARHEAAQQSGRISTSGAPGAASSASGRQTTPHVIPSGIAVGSVLRDNRIATIGILKEALDPDAGIPDGSMKGMLMCVVEGNRRGVLPSNLRLQITTAEGTQWITLAEWRAMHS